jgi:hypothetical protein
MLAHDSCLRTLETVLAADHVTAFRRTVRQPRIETVSGASGSYNNGNRGYLYIYASRIQTAISGNAGNPTKPHPHP